MTYSPCRLRAPMSFMGIATFLLALFCAVPAHALSTHDFVEKATSASQFEISSSRLALQNSQNEDVKGFAQQMIDDHTQASSDLKKAVASTSLPPDQPTPSIDQTSQKKLDKLSKLSGADFDTQYVKMQVAAHNDAVSLFRDYAKNGDQGPVKDFAQKTLPTLKQHQMHIKQIKASM